MKIVFSCTGCPVQAQGKINRFDWYFRSRGDTWTFEVSRKLFKKPIIFYGEGLYDDNENSGFGAGHMSTQKARAIILKCLALFRTARPDLIGHWIERPT